IETDERFHFTGRFYRGNDRELRWIEMTGYLQSGSDGRARCLLGTAADITERKNAEVREKTAAAEARAAAEANAKFRVFFEQGSYFAGVMALDGTVLEANDVSLEACGFRREDVIGRKFWECGWWSPSGELMEMIKAASALAADGKIFRKETPYFIADGSQRVVDLILAPVTDHNGHILYIAPTGTDITERKQVEERLRLLDALGELTRSASDPHAVMSATTRLLGQHLKASRCAYADVDDDNDRFTIRDDWNADGISTTAGVYSLDLFGPRAATGLREGRTLIINDVDAELAPHEGADMFNAIGIKAIITCPLVKEGRLAAMMAVHHRSPRRWTQEEILLVQEVVERSWAHIERVRSVETLKDSETKSANALAIARLGTFDWNMSNNEVQSSQRTKEIFSLNAEEARRAEAYFSRIHPDDVERVRREIEAALEVDGRLHTQYRIRLPDGAVRHIVSMSACQRDAFGAWSRHIGVFDDVTEQKHAEAALRDSEAHLSSIFEQTAVGIAEADLNGQLLRVNDQYCRILDRNREEIVGHYMQEFTHPDHLGHNLSLLEQMMRDGQAFELEKQYLRPDGTGVWVGVTVSLIKGHSEQPSGSLLAVAIDITQRKQAEDRLRDADRRKDEFLAMLAHELRNPLAPIKAAADILQMGRFDEARVKQTSEIISRQARHMASLVDDLLDVSRVTRGLVTLEKETLDTKRIVSDAIEQVRPLIETRRHHLAVHMPPESASVMGDKKRLVQVVANILNNAAKYTPEGGQISLRMEVQDGHVMLTVSDNGIGMSADLTQRAFELFAQAERTSDRSQGGLGIGLALVKSLVELHGGHVTAFSEGAGKGSRFTICLPLQAEQEAGATAQHHDALPRAPAKPLKIMVVDDNVDAARMLAMFSETLGHDVVVEHSSEKALARAGEEKPDVYLLDIGLPGMDGNELARRLRAHPSAADAVLVAVTGYGQEQDRKGALNAGFDHHFVKPVDTRRLAQLLSEIS
ncbi:MAG: hypothetical protein K0S28_982, partial [Paucimonas sp.]|nr:hypothetical protein [Paucimonas sp.]